MAVAASLVAASRYGTEQNYLSNVVRGCALPTQSSGEAAGRDRTTHSETHQQRRPPVSTAPYSRDAYSNLAYGTGTATHPVFSHVGSSIPPVQRSPNRTSCRAAAAAASCWSGQWSYYCYTPCRSGRHDPATKRSKPHSHPSTPAAARRTTTNRARSAGRSRLSAAAAVVGGSSGSISSAHAEQDCARGPSQVVSE